MSGDYQASLHNVGGPTMVPAYVQMVFPHHFKLEKLPYDLKIVYNIYFMYTRRGNSRQWRRWDRWKMR